MADDEANRLGMVAVGQRDPQRRRHCKAGADARNHVVSKPRRFQFGDLLAGATEDHRIAGLQSDDATSGFRQRDDHLVDLVLLATWPAGALAHQDALGLAAG